MTMINPQLFHMMSNISQCMMPFPWPLPPQARAHQTKASPPPSPPTLCSTNSWSQRSHNGRVTSFTIDSILGNQKKNMEAQLHASAVSGDMINLRPAPYHTVSSVEKTYSGNQNSINNNGGGGKSAKSKRIRTIFTAEQLERLETEFARQQYMVGPERVYLASTLQLTEAQVKVWFQNRRIKWRKQYIELQQNRFPSDSSSNQGSDQCNSQSPPPSATTPENSNLQVLDSCINRSPPVNASPSKLSTQCRIPCNNTTLENSRCSTPASSSGDLSRSSSPNSPAPADEIDILNSSIASSHDSSANSIEDINLHKPSLSNHSNIAVNSSLSHYVQLNHFKNSLFAVKDNCVKEEQLIAISL